MTVLDLSKMLMYDFHYRYIKERYPDGKSELLFTDTDSLCYSIKTADVYQDILEDKHLFDFSDYPITHKCFSAENKKKIGKMKDELKSVSLREFIGLKPKMYSLLYSDKNKIIECKKAKGVKKSTLKTKISHADYKNTLLNNSVLNASACYIRSFHHNLHTIKQNKKSLSSFDDKRYLLADGIRTLAHGHYRIRNGEM